MQYILHSPCLLSLHKITNYMTTLQFSAKVVHYYTWVLSSHNESRTSPECYMLGKEAIGTVFWYEQGRSLWKMVVLIRWQWRLWIQWNAFQALALKSNLYECLCPLPSLISAPVALTGAQDYLDVCLIFLPLCFSLHIHFFLHLALFKKRLPGRLCCS